MKIDLPYEAADEIVIALLYDGYDSCYWSYSEDIKTFKSDPHKYAWKQEDIDYNDDTLDAFERILKHYTARGDEVVPRKLQAIRDRRDYKDKIIRGMSQKTK
jgi:bifunctional pyridoxal-dependent enzyme with beta-cystathionase and maltose regulon repressor activities